MYQIWKIGYISNLTTGNGLLQCCKQTTLLRVASMLLVANSKNRVSCNTIVFVEIIMMPSIAM